MTAPSAGADRVGSGSWHQFQLCMNHAGNGPGSLRCAHGPSAGQQSCRPSHPQLRACGSAFTACTGTLACMPACSHKPAQVSKGQLAGLQGAAAKAGMQGLAFPSAQGQFNELDSFTCVAMRPERQRTYLARGRDRPPSPKQAAGSKRGREWNHPTARASSTGGVMCAEGSEGH